MKYEHEVETSVTRNGGFGEVLVLTEFMKMIMEYIQKSKTGPGRNTESMYFAVKQLACALR